ncbi:hypothetical protein PMI27_001407 [Pseudomonas sp. GM41(2012)]|jgi:hypothetical protein|nr:hypothetical protein PMI27_001407 [Pseudomonas sp. GM41(2012)]
MTSDADPVGAELARDEAITSNIKIADYRVKDFRSRSALPPLHSYL